MKRLIILTFGILIMHTAFAGNENYESIANDANEKNTSSTTTQLPSNYEQFQYRFLNQNTGTNGVQSINFNGGDDYTVLYVAGGIAILTTSFIMLNGNNEYTGEFGAANTGILIGGSVSSAVLITKFFIDKYR
ncbi:MAG: hypothetical protein ACQESJ_06600 [Bacteroidota bacterium]